MINRFLSFVLLTFHFLSAQNVKAPVYQHPPNALQLSLNSYRSVLSLQPFKGSVISYKRHFSHNWAVRFGVSTYFLENREKSEYEESTDINKQNNFYYQKGLSFNANLLYYLWNRSSLQLYLGSGPGFGWQSQKEINEKQKFGSFSWNLFIGAEWYIKNRLSLGLEYVFLYSYSKSRLERSFAPDHFLERDITTNAFIRLPIKLVVSVYF